ncbi:MAG: MFS transporter, partial [Pseudomonadota bacterium]
ARHRRDYATSQRMTATAYASAPTQPGGPPRPSKASFRFVALMAFLISCVALGIDLMLASLPQIGEDLSPTDPERATLIMGVFFLALGVSTFAVGPLLDAWGRRPVILGGLGLYALGGLLCWVAPSLTLMLIGRALMGLGAAAPRVGIQAIVRDRYEGRGMAATISIIMMIFTLVPGIAPLLGAWIDALLGWRAVFLVFVLFGLGGAAWFYAQQPETLAEPRPLSIAAWRAQVRESLTFPVFRQTLFIQLFTFASLYGLLSAGPAIFTETYDAEALYPYIFGFVSIAGAGAAFANARLVGRLGMVRLIRRGLVVYAITVISGLTGLVAGGGILAFIIPMFAGFFVLGFVIGNSQALALQPLGHISGTASATLVAGATLGAGALSIPVPLFFGGAPEPMLITMLGFASTALWFAFRLELD